jgi:hypothetical protein
MCLVLIIALPILSIGSTPADSIPHSTRDSLIRGNEKQRFNLAYTSLLYWWQYAIEQEKIMSHKDSIIATYVEQTGLQSNNVEDLKKIIENKEMVEESICDDKVEKAVEKSDRRKKRWRTTAIVAGGVAVVEGLVIYIISFL